MAFTAKPIAEEADYEITSDGRLVKTYDEMWLCEDNVYHTLDDVIVKLNILPGATYAGYNGAFCRKLKPVRLFHLAPAFAWHVGVNYSSDTPKFAENPMDRPVKRKIFSNETQRVIFRDANGDIILNAAGDPPDGGLPVNHHMPTVGWQRNEDDFGFSMFQFAQYSGKLNADTFGGCDPGTLLLIATADETFEANFHFWQCGYTMIFNDQGWQPQFVNAGVYQIVYATGGTRTHKLIRDDDNQPITDPQPLYEIGSPQEGSQVPIFARPNACNFIKVNYSGTMSFDSLSLSLA